MDRQLLAVKTLKTWLKSQTIFMILSRRDKISWSFGLKENTRTLRLMFSFIWTKSNVIQNLQLRILRKDLLGSRKEAWTIRSLDPNLRLKLLKVQKPSREPWRTLCTKQTEKTSTTLIPDWKSEVSIWSNQLDSTLIGAPKQEAAVRIAP